MHPDATIPQFWIEAMGFWISFAYPLVSESLWGGLLYVISLGCISLRSLIYWIFEHEHEGRARNSRVIPDGTPSHLRGQSRIVVPEHLEWFSTFFLGGSPVSERTVALKKKGIANGGFLTHRGNGRDLQSP
jgi:hypothetical protein